MADFWLTLACSFLVRYDPWINGLFLRVEHLPGVKEFATAIKAPEVNVGGFALALLVLIFSRVTRFHDRISDIFKIRARFDRANILLPLAVMSGAQMSARQVANLKRERHPLVRATFYKYASSRSEHPLVDKHDIESALEAWHILGCLGVALHTHRLRGLIRLRQGSLVSDHFLDRLDGRASIYASSVWIAGTKGGSPDPTDSRECRGKCRQPPSIHRGGHLMWYKIGKDIIVRSENAAKPETQSSAYLKKLISRLEPIHSSFDFGCGKLRYERAIAKTTGELALVDSEVQLSRGQMIRGRSTTIRDYVGKSNHVHALTVGQFASHDRRYDRGFCINVLSVIPSASVRLGIVQLMRAKLKPNGTCLFVTLYRNSDFTRMQNLPNCQPYGNGFLMDSLRGHSFYGLIPPDDLAGLVKRAGFSVESIVLDEGSAYLWARTPDGRPGPINFEIRETAENFQIRSQPSVSNRSSAR
ncbi:SAM-dependent methyltransferase [Bradyrhizobium japonicum]